MEIEPWSDSDCNTGHGYAGGGEWQIKEHDTKGTK